MQKQHNNSNARQLQVLTNECCNHISSGRGHVAYLIFIIPLFLIQMKMMFSIYQISYNTDLEVSFNRSNSTTMENINENESILCGGCFFSKTNESTTCGHYIRQLVFQSIFNVSNDSDNENEKEEKEKERWLKIQQMQLFNKTEYMKIVRKAAYQVSVDFPHVCFRCDPGACRQSVNNGGGSSSGTIYYPYDVAAPKIQQSWTYYLNSIPAENRYPLHGLNNPDEFLSNSENKKKPWFFEFNPSIIVIPEHERQTSFKHPTTGIVKYPVYLASFRVSQVFLCVSMAHFYVHSHPGTVERLGLAYLDENFDILAEGTYDISEEDVRLVSLQSPHSIQQQQIYLTYCQVQTNNDSTFRRAMQRELWLNKPYTEGQYITKEPLYVDSTRQSMPPIYIRDPPNCFTVTDAVIDAKNIVYFDDATITSQTMSHLVVDGVNYTTTHITNPVTVAETWPPQDDGSHKVAFVELQKPKWCPAAWSPRVTDGELVSDIQYPTNMSSPIVPSFYTIEEQWLGENLISQMVPWSKDRGNACCIEMINPRTNQNVLVGISHVRIDSRAYATVPDTYRSVFGSALASYLSRFYAFEPTRPYRTVALSGHFCWPLITSSEDENRNQYANMGEKFMYIKSTNQTGTGWCPAIHFAMSLLYKENSNKSSVIISLGVNDCSPRFIEILTSDISELLFYGLSRQ